MSKEKLSRILSIIIDCEKRQHLIDFKLVAFCVSKQVENVIDGDDEYFYRVLSQINVDENGYAEALFKKLKLYITVIEVEDEEQQENLIIFHIVSIDEELERQLEQESISEFLESGVIEIE